MAYTLDEFCAESRAALKAAPLGDALPQIADRLARLLSNPAFVAETFSDDMPPGRRVLHHDPETDFYVLGTCRKEKRPASRTATAHRGRSTATRGNIPR